MNAFKTEHKAVADFLKSRQNYHQKRLKKAGQIIEHSLAQASCMIEAAVLIFSLFLDNEAAAQMLYERADKLAVKEDA